LANSSTGLSILRTLVFFAVLGWGFIATAAPPAVEKHDLNCGNTFPCPPEIQRRVDFWVMVFRAWNTNQLIFHDANRPERVYSVSKSKFTCSRRKPARSIERERSRIKNALLGVAKKLTQAQPGYTREEKEFLSLFPSRNAREVRTAAENVRCQQGNRDRFVGALKRYESYKDHILQVLDEAGLSKDIVYLPFVESAYNPRAYSRVGAAGLWQIMPRTARTLGLQLSSTIDERFDAEASSWAAARYLRQSTDSLTAKAKKIDPNVSSSQINPFVITSYNYGLAGMRRAMDQVGPDYIAVLNKYKSRSFRTAVRNFYASFLAARYVAQNSNKYFGSLKADDSFRHSIVVLKNATSVERAASVFKVSRDELKKLNPALTSNVWKGWRLIPDGYSLRLPYRKDRWKKQVARLEQMKPESPLLSGNQYVVVKGDTACEIARVHGVRCRDLVQLNNLGRRALIRVGQKLEIPAKAGSGTKVATTAKIPEKVARVEKRKSDNNEKSKNTASVKKPATVNPDPVVDTSGVYQQLIDNISVEAIAGKQNGKYLFSIIVQPEETMGHYADWLGIGSTRPIRKRNGMRNSQNLIVGKKIILPVNTDEQLRSFVDSRKGFHRTLVEQFQQHYEILGVDHYIVRNGDSMWKIAQKLELPYWVLTNLNPGTAYPAVGDKLVVPVAKARKPSKEPPSTQGS
jgi:membrane-bound lytic murein transglycosylase D